MNRITVDIETYSSVDLPKTGVYRYAESSDFKILMAAWSVDGGPVLLDTDERVIRRRLEKYLQSGCVFVAHNAQFERVCFSRLLGMPPGQYLRPEDWHDTQAIAAEQGYPIKLEAVAKALGGEQKDSAGTRLINIFSKPNRKGTRTLPEEKPVEWQQFKDYCIQDVVTTVDVDRMLGDWPTPMEREVFLADQRINDLGIRIDVEMAAAAVEAADDNRMEQELRVMHLTGVDNPGSQPQFLKWCQTAISPKIKNLQAATIQKLLDSDRLAPVHREVLENRQELALVASKKYATALMSVSPDDRLRGTLKFFGAHTGRWSGKGTQLQNLPREAFKDPVEQEAAILDLKLGLGASSLTLKKLVRPLFTGPFTVVDYSAIEARVVAWLAGEQWALDAFAEGRDIYVETANRMGGEASGMGRDQGKVAVLALGYNGGVNSLKAMAGDPKALAKMQMPPGVKVGAPNFVEMFQALNPDIPARYLKSRKTDDVVRTESQLVDGMLQRIVDEWRAANPSIVRLWALLGDAVESGGAAGDLLNISRDGDTMRLHLPSGRAITYHGVAYERYRVTDPETGRSLLKRSWRYDDPKRPGQRIGTYGGRLCENATQAVARDILAAALVRLQRAGYTVVGHVHDEILVEGEHDPGEIERIMCRKPRWAKGLPVSGEGFVTQRYAKG